MGPTKKRFPSNSSRTPCHRFTVLQLILGHVHDLRRTISPEAIVLGVFLGDVLVRRASREMDILRHSDRDAHAHFADVLQLGIRRSRIALFLSDTGGQGLGSDEEVLVRDCQCVCEHRAETHSGEDVRVVALSGHDGSAVGQRDGVERRTTREDCLTVRREVGLLCSAFRLGDNNTTTSRQRESKQTLYCIVFDAVY